MNSALPDTSSTPQTSTTARPSPSSPMASPTPSRSASRRSSSVADSPRRVCRTTSFMPGSRSGAAGADAGPDASRREGRQCCSTPPSRRPSSVARGPRRPAQDPHEGGGAEGGGRFAFPRQLAETIEGAELFLYPGDRHLFADNSFPITTKAPRPCSSNACSASSTTSSSCNSSPPDDLQPHPTSITEGSCMTPCCYHIGPRSPTGRRTRHRVLPAPRCVSGS
jgi:hypothetical protein